MREFVTIDTAFIPRIEISVGPPRPIMQWKELHSSASHAKWLFWLAGAPSTEVVLKAVDRTLIQWPLAPLRKQR